MGTNFVRIGSVWREARVAMRADPAISAKIRRAAVSERRSLYLWMLANFDEFSATVAEAGRPNWKALAKAFAEEGLTDVKGRDLAPEATRLTWLKVRKAVEKKAIAKSAVSERATASPTVSPIIGVRARDDDDDFPLPTIQKPQR
jgi:hypothetical protein